MKKILAFLALVGLVAAVPASADNYKPNPSTGATIASDTIGGIEFPRVKMTFGVDGLATDVSATNPLPTARQDAGIVPFTNGAALNALLFSVDTSGYGTAAVHITGTFAATVSWQASDDNVNWFAITAQNSSTTSFATTINGVGGFTIPTQHRYLRGLVSAYTSGTVAGAAVLRYSTLDPSASTVLAGGAGQIGGVVASASITSPGAPAFSSYLLSALATTNPALIKATAGRVIGGGFYNVSTTVKFIKFFNKTTAPVVGTDTPAFVIIVPPSTYVPVPTTTSPTGYYFSSGIGIGITGGISTADVTPVATAGDVLVSLLYL